MELLQKIIKPAVYSKSFTAFSHTALLYYKVDPTIKEMIDYREKTILAALLIATTQTFVKSLGQEVKSQQRDDDVSTIFSTSIALFPQLQQQPSILRSRAKNLL